MKKSRLLLLFIIPVLNLFSLQGESSYPYQSGYTWAYFCDWKLLGADYHSNPENFRPEDVKLGDTIFVDYACLGEFGRNYLPRIQHKVIVITSNYGFDADSPMPGPYAYLLQEDKIAAWFLQNIDRDSTEKLIPIPIGLASRNWSHGDTTLLDKWIPIALEKEEKSHFVYVNFSPWQNRLECLEHFNALGFKNVRGKDYSGYLEDLSDSLFVISPPGNGEDCHRTWEALLMGCIPVVKSSHLNPLFEDLPVVIVDHWNEVTIEFLQEEYKKIQGRNFSWEKLYAPYWFRAVRKVQERVRETGQ